MILYNHISHKIGNYAKKLASHIPEGGNWKDITLPILDKKTGWYTCDRWTYNLLWETKMGFA